MPIQSPHPVNPFASCHECGAERQPGAKFCWLCGAAVESTPHNEAAPILAEAVNQESPAQPHDVNPWLVHGTIWLGIIVAAVVCWGLAANNMFMGLAFAVAALPAILISLTTSVISRASGHPMHPAAKLLVGLGVTAVSVPLAVLVALLAIVIGLFQICTTGHSPLFDALGR